MTRPNSAPRCFGLGSMFGADSSICGVCAFHDACLPVAIESLIKTTKIIGDNNVALMHVCVKIEEVEGIKIKLNDSPPIDGISKAKLQTLVKQITSANPCFADYINSHRNPFSVSTKPAYLKPLVDHMLTIDNTDEALINFLIDVFDKKEKEARQLIQLIKEAFHTLGFID